MVIVDGVAVHRFAGQTPQAYVTTGANRAHVRLDARTAATRPTGAGFREHPLRPVAAGQDFGMRIDTAAEVLTHVNVVGLGPGVPIDGFRVEGARRPEVHHDPRRVHVGSRVGAARTVVIPLLNTIPLRDGSIEVKGIVRNLARGLLGRGNRRRAKRHVGRRLRAEVRPARERGD